MHPSRLRASVQIPIFECVDSILIFRRPSYVHQLEYCILMRETFFGIKLIEEFGFLGYRRLEVPLETTCNRGCTGDT